MQVQWSIICFCLAMYQLACIAAVMVLRPTVAWKPTTAACSSTKLSDHAVDLCMKEQGICSYTLIDRVYGGMNVLWLSPGSSYAISILRYSWGMAGRNTVAPIFVVHSTT